ncbi:hypothetical protein CCACVL1_21779 [Corchorus capsularis]|uniref:Uncharacterized protein n=1 Tax=Corchorus capsularis TaxID=210143 RepID=A0A1R3FY73_COCAP|nr:hypothetical protein CCACVL1_30260 [Corchorus capsularis]OMO64399.1 hypothetical protein CCACVL1_21780 [Corchorus capsularis]OMO64421.1 hypothetical protein CCACVL1_21779 [Corchorus capsularis]
MAHQAPLQTRQRATEVNNPHVSLAHSTPRQG